VSDVPTVELLEQLRHADTGLRDVLTAREAESAELRAMMHALGLQVAELQRRLGRAATMGDADLEGIDNGLRRDPNQRLPVDPAVCRGSGDDLSGATDAGKAWSQSWDVKIILAYRVSAPATAVRARPSLPIPGCHVLAIRTPDERLA
jgi:hypothetical protein